MHFLPTIIRPKCWVGGKKTGNGKIANCRLILTGLVLKKVNYYKINANIALNGYWVDEIFVIIWFWMLTLKALDDSKLYWEQEQWNCFYGTLQQVCKSYGKSPQ